MKITQLSVFMENKPGQLSHPCRVLGEAGVSILCLSLADTTQFGILRLIVKDWQKAKAVLEQAGCVVRVTEVVAVSVADAPGSLAKLLEHLEQASINVEYIYAYSDRTTLIFRFEQPDAAIQTLESKGFEVIRGRDLLG
ncbi:MAG TPA: amino acid-binding protein [Planctomycetota bacterium]|jgi:hypothetical protein